MANTLAVAFTIDQPAATVEISTNSGYTWAPLTVPASGNTKTGNLLNVAAGFYDIGVIQLRGVGFPTSVVKNLASVTIVGAATAPATQLAAPANPQATASGANAMSVTASSVTYNNGYKLYRSATSAGTFAVVATITPGNPPTVTDGGLTASTAYFYQWQTLGNGTTYLDSALSAVFSGTTAAAGSAVAYIFDKMGQSNSVGGAPINADPTRAGSVSYNPEEALTAGPLTRVSPMLTRTFTRVYIWNNTAQAWQPYNVTQNAQGFTGNESNGATVYMPGFCSFLGLAQWWEANRPNDYLLLRKAGAVGQPIAFFQKAYGDGINNTYHTVATNTWNPSMAALPALQTQLGIGTVNVLGHEWVQGETEGATTTYAANLTTLIGSLRADGYWPKTATSLDVIAPTVLQPDINRQKADYIAANTQTVTYSPNQLTHLIDDIHWDTASMYYAGAVLLPQALGLAAVTPKYLFKGYAETAGNTVSRWRDEGGRYGDLLAPAGLEPVLVTLPQSNKTAYAVGAAHRAKLMPGTNGGLQRVPLTAKTIHFVLKQPANTTPNPHYLFENNSYSSSPGLALGPVSSLGNYIGSAQDFTTPGILTLELATTATTTTDFKGILTVYKNGAVIGSGPCSMDAIGGGPRPMALFTPASETYLQYAALFGDALQAFVAVDGTNATQRQADIAALTARYTIGTTATPPPASTTTITGAQPTGTAMPLVFAPAEVGIYANAAGNYTRAAGASIDLNATALATTFLAAGTSGRVSFQYQSTAAQTAPIGFNINARRVSLGFMTYGCYVNASGILQGITNGADTVTGVTATLGNYYALTRIGNTGALVIEESTDGATWTVRYTYPTTTVAALYVPMHLFTTGSVLQNPRQQSLTVLNVPTTSGFFDTAEVGGDFNATGYLSVANALLSTAAASYSFIWTPGRLTAPGGFGQYLLPLAVGMSGGTDEAFSMTVNTGVAPATINTRVRSTAGAFVFTDNLTNLVVNQPNHVCVVMDATSMTLYVNGVATATKPTGYVPAPSSSPLTLGGAIDVANGSVAQLPAAGTYKNLGIWNRVLTATEVNSLFTSGGAPGATAPAHFFPLSGTLTSSTTTPDTVDTTKAAAVYAATL